MDDLIIISDPRPTRADAVRNRDAILCTARRMFDALGVDAVTMSAIAQEAEVGKGTLYRNFPDKFSLVQELLDHEQRDLQERTLNRLREGGVPFDNLVWFMNNVLAFVWRNMDILRGGGALPLEAPAHHWWRQTIRGLIQQAKSSQTKSSEANVNADTDYAADVLYVMLNPRVIQYQQTARQMTAEQINAALADTAGKLINP